jgi:hypothetical protein
MIRIRRSSVANLVNRIVLAACVLAALLAGCGSGVDSWPRPAADRAARESIVAGGGDPEDWIVDNRCGSSGTCGVEMSARCDPDRVVAINRYRIKDSFPTLLGSDRIRHAAERVFCK